MVNLYRFCIAILFASLSSAVALENCRVETVYDKNVDVDSFMSINGSGNTKTSCSDDDQAYCYRIDSREDHGSYLLIKGSHGWLKYGESHMSPFSRKINYKLIEKEICIDPKPDLSDWENCKKGKDSGSSKIIVGDGSDGLPPTIVREDWWACDDPDIWITYRHPPQEGSIEGDGDKPTDPTDPDKPTDPTDPDKPGEGGEGGDDSGNGSENGSEGGSDGGSENGSDQGSEDGKGLSKDEVQEAVEGALDSKGQELEGKINKWWLTTQGDMEREGKTMGHEADSILDDAFAGIIVKKNINDFDREYRFQLPASKQCPAPIPIKIDFLGIDIQFEFTLICEFLEMMGLLVLASAYMSAIYIIMGLREV